MASYGTTCPSSVATCQTSVKWAQARIIAEVLDPSFSIRIKNFSNVFDVAEVIGSKTFVTSTSGVVNVTYSKTYNDPPFLTAIMVGGSSAKTTSRRDSRPYPGSLKGPGLRVASDTRGMRWYGAPVMVVYLRVAPDP